ncbi:hypothetical protein [Microbacterium bovistercoris]|uniref:hypothetical protein n=1 Tax=Microbacterium bovistercoris TaxID=2293570 RepID=UPI0011C04951|nr:hypothetical protein [Microbacterium bovistercoris]
MAVTGLVVGIAAVDALRPNAVAESQSRASVIDIERLNEALAGQGSVGDAHFLDCTLSETLPNFAIAWDGEPGQRIFEATIDGMVSGARPGSGHRESVGGDDTVEREILGFEDKTAYWRTVVLSVEVLNDFDSEADMPSEIKVVLWLDGATDPAVILRGLPGQRIFAVLEAPGRLEPSDAYPVARNGALIGVVSDDGALSLPGLDVYEDGYMDGLTTLSAIETASEAPMTVLPLSTANGYWERTDCS